MLYKPNNCYDLFIYLFLLFPELILLEKVSDMWLGFNYFFIFLFLTSININIVNYRLAKSGGVSDMLLFVYA